VMSPLAESFANGLITSGCPSKKVGCTQSGSISPEISLSSIREMVCGCGT
jgi:hypothetical protein